MGHVCVASVMVLSPECFLVVWIARGMGHVGVASALVIVSRLFVVVVDWCNAPFILTCPLLGPSDFRSGAAPDRTK